MPRRSSSQGRRTLSGGRHPITSRITVFRVQAEGRRMGRAQTTFLRGTIERGLRSSQVHIQSNLFESTSIAGIYSGQADARNAALKHAQKIQATENTPVYIVDVQLPRGAVVRLEDVHINRQSINELIKDAIRDVTVRGVDSSSRKVTGQIRILMAGLPGGSGTDPDDAPRARYSDRDRRLSTDLDSDEDTEQSFGLPGRGGTDPDDEIS